MSKKKDKDKKIRKLRTEIRRLKKQNAALTRALCAIGATTALKSKAHRIALESAASRASLFSKKSYGSFLIGSFKLRSVFSFYQRLVFVVRRYTFVTTTLKILTFLLGILQSSAVIVLFTGTMAVALPLTLVFSYTAAVLSFIFRKRLTKKMRSLILGKHVTVFFPPSGKAFEKGSFFRGMVQHTASETGSVCVVVSPYALSPVGLTKKRSFFLAARRDGERIIIMRTHYFFTFKKILSSHDKKITFVF